MTIFRMMAEKKKKKKKKKQKKMPCICTYESSFRPNRPDPYGHAGNCLVSACVTMLAENQRKRGYLSMSLYSEPGAIVDGEKVTFSTERQLQKEKEKNKIYPSILYLTLYPTL